jgi:hypothetical protein
MSFRSGFVALADMLSLFFFFLLKSLKVSELKPASGASEFLKALR